MTDIDPLGPHQAGHDEIRDTRDGKLHAREPSEHHPPRRAVET
ncbi:hypothetical protein [Sphingomonas phyllosphaerae]|nr:hypothetical protein [Sphingomonas phyllosphaerae]